MKNKFILFAIFFFLIFKETLIFYQNLSYAMGLRPLEPPKIKNNKNKLNENQKEALINQSFLKINAYSKKSLEVITLDEAINKALKNNPYLSAKTVLIEAAKSEKKEVVGERLPQINFISLAKRTNEPYPIAPFKGSSFSRDVYSFNINLEFPIYEGGRISKKVKIADIETAIRKNLKKQTINDIIANIENTFYLGIYLRSLIKTQENIVNSLEKVYRDATLKFKVGRIPRLDLLKIKTQLISEKTRLKTTEEYLKRTKQALYVLMGEPPEYNFILSGNLTEDIFIPPKDMDIEHLISNRPDIIAAKQEVQKARENLLLVWRKHLPSIDLFSNYGRNAGSGFNKDKEIWEVGLKFKLNIYSGGSISSKVNRAKKELIFAKQMLNAKILDAKKQIRDAISKLYETKDLIAGYKVAKESAKEAFRVESLKYKTGAGTVTDMLIAQAEWLKAESEYLKSIYMHKNAKIKYDYAISKIAIHWTSK